MIVDEAWADVAASFALAHKPRDIWLRTLARNLDALRRFRPTIYAAVVEAINGGTLDAVRPHARDRRSDDAIDSAFDDVDACRKAGACVAILGVGDGGLVRAMAKFAPRLQLGRQQEIVVVEPDLGRLIDALGSNDWTGPAGPIEQPRFEMYLGEQWARTLVDDLLAQPTKIYPQVLCAGGEPRPELDAAFELIADQVRAAQRARRSANVAFYAAKDDADLLDVLGPTPARRPRALMLTSQFTAVLQHSTNDSADALRQLGWDVSVLTEPRSWHCITPPAVEAAIAAFRPDVVFQIDHLRYEHGEVVPPRLPFICWIQDHLTNLTAPVAGQSIGARDFVLTGGVYKYVDRHGYPRQQCLDMAKVSREPIVPASWDEDAQDILYVSHWSQQPAQILIETSHRVGEIAGVATQRLFEACAVEVASVYANGGALRLDLELREIVRRLAKRDGCSMIASTEQFLVDVLFQRLNNAYYRQQALTWAGEIAEARGLRFGIYGSGWDKHPTLGRFARGTVTYGADLESLTRRSKILLQLEPYPCFSHQRMLDAVLAGGFVLVRSHPMNTLAVTIRTFLDAHVPASIYTTADARRAMPPHARAAFESLLVDAEMFGAMGDVVDVIRGWQRGGTLGDGDAALPFIAETEFDDRATLASLVDRFVNDRNERRRIGRAQRTCIAERLTYVSALGRAMRQIHGRLLASLPATQQQEAA